MFKNILLILMLGLLFSCVQTETIKSANQDVDDPSVVCDVNAVPGNLKDPQSIQQLINLINALPKPLTSECLIKSLKRPLYVHATASTFSAQPANSWSSPRIFIFKGNLIIAVVPTGNGSKLLEFSEMTNLTRSIKGEVLLPIETDLTNVDPYVRINITNRTTCSGCHGSEQFERSLDGVPLYSSLAFRPISSEDVPLDYLKESHYLCQAQLNKTQRCSFYDSLFSYGEVFAKPFPETMPLPQNVFGI